MDASKQNTITPEQAREKVVRAICEHAEAITQAVIREAESGKYLSAKFLFDLAGITMPALMVESEPEGPSLKELLLQPIEEADPNDTEVIK